MNKISEKLSPSATDMIRMDHTRVLATFHQYELDASPKTKQSNVNANCLALEIHMQIEEEFFYPALRGITSDDPVLKKSVPEHNRLRQLIAQLHAMDPADTEYDRTYMDLLRNVLHHVADEEAVLLPEAETLLAERVHEIGGQMMKRKMQLMARHAGDVIKNKVRANPTPILLAGGVLLAGAYLAHRTRGRTTLDKAKEAVSSMTPSSLVPSPLTPSGMAAERASFKLGKLVGAGKGMLWGKRMASQAGA